MKRIVLLSTLTFSCPAMAADLYVYSVEVAKMRAPNLNSDAPAEVVAWVLARIQPKACIDLRMMGSSSTNDLLNHGTVGVLTNQPLSRRVDDAIRKEVCARSERDCRVDVRSIRYPLADVMMQFEGPPEGRATSPGGSKPRQRFLKSVPLRGQIPTMGNACKTGKYADSWNNAASTPEARRYIEGIIRGQGFQFKDIRSFGLIRKGSDGSAFSFGFPRHK